MKLFPAHHAGFVCCRKRTLAEVRREYIAGDDEFNAIANAARINGLRLFQNVYGLSDQMYSLLYGINGIGIIVTAELSGILSRRLSLVQQLGSGLVIGFIGSVLVMLSGIRNSIALAIIGLFLVVATLGIVNSVVTTLAMDRQGEHAGVASSILGIGMYSIGIICTPLVGIMGSHTYLPLALLIFLCEIGALGVYRVMKQEARP